MKEFMQLEANAPATLEAVVAAVARLSTLGEAQILQIASEGRLGEFFPFRPRRNQEIPPDFMSLEDLVEASPLPLSREEHVALIQSSMTPPAPRKSERRSVIARALQKLQRS
jgi:hypothetical protein